MPRDTDISLSLLSKSYPVQTERNIFFVPMHQPDITQNRSAWAEMGHKLSIALTNKEYSTILRNRSLRTELSIDINPLHYNGEGGSYNKPIPEVDYLRRRFNFFQECVLD